MPEECECRWARAGLAVADDVADALRAGRPVVALESTIISHGMPYPENLRTAEAVEGIVRQSGAVPATIAILGGVPHIGLTALQLEALARAGSRARKTSRRDLAFVVAQRLDGATTVSATMFLAHLADIKVFVTGGIGGVHRGGHISMDISADLVELGRTPVAVVCAGVKSILDIPRTLEFLETQGVPVVTLGATSFPAFFTRDSGCQSPMSVGSPQSCAGIIDAQLRLNVGSGVLVAVPIPLESEAEGHLVEAATTAALEMAEKEGIAGPATTPFLLSKIKELSGGASLAANVALIKNNALVGSAIAAALSAMRSGQSQSKL